MNARICACLIVSAMAAIATSSPAALAQDQPAHHDAQYRAFNLGAPLGGSFAAANAVNNLGWAAGESNLAGNNEAHAVVWIYGLPVDLGTLGGPNSAVLWPGLNDLGEAVGISDTDITDPYGESWSCGAFLPASHAGHTCVGFVWQWGHMRALPTLGGSNGFATGVNNLGQVVGWAENTIHDPTCVSPQVLQFEAVIWGPRGQVQALSPYPGDPDSAATGINDRQQVIGISGICQNAVGNQTAKHAVLWQNGTPTNLGNLGGSGWHTPMAINNQGQIVGFSDLAGDQGGSNPNFHAFLWVRPGPMRDLGTLPGDAISEGLGINSQGQIVGVSFAAGFGNPRAFIYRDGRMIDLNTLVQPNSQLYLQVAGDINDAGVIAGQACYVDSCSSSDPSVAFIAVPTSDGRFDVSTDASATSGSTSHMPLQMLFAAASKHP